ncbi:uncharacterized protein LOC129238057 [Anastrepha obliqua]|uniref:uncharacterized protein LOC129238057 n=1 Tax=Anastrepha obliqua TaxID=95512 RepID=UPI002409DF8D|nr:uncharacterized protein LOC129238057 [Anastrepha obliqua]
MLTICCQSFANFLLLYTIFIYFQDYAAKLDGIGLCVVNLMDDMHEYMRGLFLLMYCAPTVLLAYLYIRTSQELRPPDGPLAVMMFEHRADIRNRQRNLSASSAGGSVGATITTTSGIGSALTTHTNGGSGSGSGVGHTSSVLSATCSATKTRSYDLYSAELDVYREKRKQRNFGSMAAAQVVCLCPLMILRFARLSMVETYENQKHFDFTYLMFVWIAFLPTVIFPCIYASQILPRDEQKRIRGYFRLTTKRFHKSRSCGSQAGSANTPSSREGSIEKDDNTNTTQGTSILVNGEEYLNGGGSITGTALVTRHELNRAAKFQQQQQQHHNNCRLAGRDTSNGVATGQQAYVKQTLTKDVRVKKNDVKIKIISDGGKGNKSALAGVGNVGQLQARQAQKSGSVSSGSRRESVAGGGGGVGNVGERKLTLGSLDNSCSNMTSSTYCNGASSLLEDDGGASNFGDGEDSSIVSGMIVSGGGQNAVNYTQHKKWSLSGQPLLSNKDLSFSDCSSFSHMDTASTLERDLEIIDMLERERSMDIQEMIEREQHGETVRMTVGERRKLPDIDKIYQRSPKPKVDPYNYDVSAQATPTPSTATAKDSTPNSLICSDPLQSSGAGGSVSSTNDGYSAASTLNEESAAHRLPRDDEGESGIDVDEEVPSDFFDKYTPGAANAVPYASSGGGGAASITPTSAYQYQYSRRLSRKSSHHSQSSTSHRNSKRDSFNSLNGSDLIAGAFGELDPTQPLSKMSVVEGRMRRSSGRTASFSSSARSSMKSRDYSHGSSHSAHPELDFRENIFAEL